MAPKPRNMLSSAEPDREPGIPTPQAVKVDRTHPDYALYMTAWVKDGRPGSIIMYGVNFQVVSNGDTIFIPTGAPANSETMYSQVSHRNK